MSWSRDMSFSFSKWRKCKVGGSLRRSHCDAFVFCDVILILTFEDALFNTRYTGIT